MADMSKDEAIAKLAKLVNTNLHSDAYEEAHEALAALEAHLAAPAAVTPVEVETPMIREPLSRASFAAAANFHGAESAEGLAFRIGADPETEWSVAATAKYIEADRAAVDQRARVEVLREIRVLVGEMQCNGGHEYGVAYQRAVEMVEAKYAAKEPT